MQEFNPPPPKKMNFDSTKIKLIIGLGNPEPKLQNTYHNVGHLFVDYLAELLTAPKFKKQRLKHFEFSKTTNQTLIKTTTHMNNSGSAVRKSLQFFSTQPKETVIAHDDSDIILGNYKIEFGRGAAGHKGVESIIKSLKTKDFWRIRIGIRPRPASAQDYSRTKAGLSADLSAKSVRQRTETAGARRAKAGEFVLKKISSANKKILDETFQEIEKITGKNKE